MNHAQIDMLLQLPVPRPEASPAARSRDDAPIFDNQLRLASDGGNTTTSPPPSPSSRQATESSASQSRPATRDERSSVAETVSPPHRETEAPAATTVATETATADEHNHDEDAKQDDAAEVAALLAAAEQATKSELSVPVAADGKPTAALAHEVADAVDAADSADAVDAADKSTEDPHHAEGNGAPASAGDAPRENQVATTDIDLPTASAIAEGERVKQGRAELVASASIAAPVEADGSAHTDAEATTDTETTTVASAKAKPDHDGESLELAADAKTADKQPAASTQLLGQAAAVTAGTSKGAGDDAPKKSDRKANVREPAAVGDTTTQPAERAAATARTAEPPAAPPVAANVQQQLTTSAAPSVTATEGTAKSADATSAAKPGLLSPFARLERGAHGTHRAGKGETTHYVDPARFVSRVARAIQTAQERGAPLQLRLSPPELGAMRLELSVNQGSLTATIETDNSNARQLLLDNLPALRDRLAEQNVKIERFDVDVRRDSSGSQQNPGAQDRGTPEQSERGAGRHGAAPRGANRETIDETQPIRRTITNTSINVVA